MRQARGGGVRGPPQGGRRHSGLPRPAARGGHAAWAGAAALAAAAVAIGTATVLPSGEPGHDLLLLPAHQGALPVGWPGGPAAFPGLLPEALASHPGNSLRCNNDISHSVFSPLQSISLSFLQPNGTYGINDTIDIRIAPADSTRQIRLDTVDDPVHWLPTSILELETGENDRNAVFVRPASFQTSIPHADYRYTVQEGDYSADLDYKQTTSLYWRAPAAGTLFLADTSGTLNCILPAPRTAGSLSYQNDIVVDGIRPNVTAVSAAVQDGTYILGREISVNVTFGEPVFFNGSVAPPSLTLDFDGTNREAEYASGNNSDTLVFNYTLLAGDGAARLDYNATNALAAAGLEDIAGNAANLTLFAPGSPGSLAHSSRLAIDAVPPAVASVSSPDGDDTYGQGLPIRVNVTFTERVVVDEAGGTPYIELETGATDRRAEYYSGSGERSLLFRYVVDAGDLSDDLNYTGASALSDGGGTIRDAAGNDADLDLSGLPAGRTLAGSSALVVDGVAPEIASVTSPDDNGTYGTGTVVNITVGFTEHVEFDPIDARPEMPLDTGSGESRRAVCSPAAGLSAELECAYTVGAGDDTANLGYGTGSSLALGAGAAARDAAGNGLATALPDSPAGATLGGSKNIVLDTEVPEVLRVTSPNASGTPYGRGDALRIEVVFNGTVSIDPEPADGDESVPALRLETGEIDRAARYVGGSGTDTLGFAYTVAAGDFAPDLNYAGAGALSLGDRALVDMYGNRDTGDPALPDPASADSLGGQKDIGVRTVPIVEGVGANYTGASLKAGETVGVDVAFSEKVWVVPAPGGGVPHVELVTGRAERGLAVYSSGNGTDTLAFSYPVHHADDVARLDYAGAGALKNNGAQVRGVGMLDANLSLPEPGPGGPLASANIRLLPNEGPELGALPDRTVDDRVDMCGAALSRPEIAFGRIEAGGQSAAEAQEVQGTGTLPLDSVSVAASAWTGAGGAEVMPANATSARAAGGGDWTRLGGGAVDVPAGAGGRSATVEFVVDVPQGALQAGARDAMVSQSVTYTVTCAAPTE